MSNFSRTYRRHGVQVESYDDYAERLRGYGLRGWRWILYAVLVIVLAVVCSLIIVPKAAAQQTTNTFNVYSFRLSTNPQTVGAMTTAAQAQCNASLNCLIIFDPILNGFPTGNMPSQCANCTWIDYRIPGSFTVTPTNVKTMNAIRFADQFAGADCGIKIMAADADLGVTAGEIWINQNCGTAQWSNVSASANHVLRLIQGGSYNIGTITLNSWAGLFASAVQSTILVYSGSGNAVTTTGGNTISGVELSLGGSAAEGFHIAGTEVTLMNSYVTGGGSTTILTHIAPAVPGSVQSGTIKILNHRQFSYTGTAFYIDHALGVFLDNISSYGLNPNTTAVGMVIDTGVSGLYAQNCEIVQHGAGGLIIKNSTGGAGAYNQWPIYLEFTNFLDDAAQLVPNFDGALFDSTLSFHPIYATFANSWFVGHNINGVHISGGQGIKFTAGTRIRSNGTNGVLIDNANVADVEVADSFITGNNTTNNADAHGVYITAAAPRVSLIGNDIGNHLDLTGNQRFGFKITAVNADDFTAVGNNLRDNVTASYSDANTGAEMLFNNAVSGGTSCLLKGIADACKAWLQGDFQVHGNLFADANIFASNLQGTTVTVNATAFASLGAPANGTIKFCNDCTIANPCAGAGTGAMAKRLNGVWVCN